MCRLLRKCDKNQADLVSGAIPDLLHEGFETLVTDIQAPDQVNNVFGDVARMVADPRHISADIECQD